jgi:hypothetical protein
MNTVKRGGMIRTFNKTQYMNRTEPYARITLPGDDAFVQNYNGTSFSTNAAGAASAIHHWAFHGRIRIQCIGGNVYFTPESTPPIQIGLPRAEQPEF